ncbi:hypothetical protein [Aurantivibrio plasticivorans]
MSEILQFPNLTKEKASNLESIIENSLIAIPKGDREKLKFGLVKTIDSYSSFFTEWSLTIPGDCSETLEKEINEIAQQEHDRKMILLTDIIRLKVHALVTEYQQRAL